MTKLGKKRIISLLLCFTMLFSLTSIMAVADDTAEDASTSDTPHTTIAVDKTEMEVGDTVTVVVSSTAMTAASFACGIQFDLDKLECTSIVGPDEDYPSDFGLTKADTTAKNTWVDATSTSTVDEANENGKVGFVVVGTSDTEYAAGVIYTATFTAIAGGSAEFVLYEQTGTVSGTAYKNDSVDTQTVNITVAVTGITLDKTSTSLTVGDTETLTATISPEDAAAAVTWESDNESVATVSNGVVTAKGAGTANITATVGNYSATCAVTVNAIDASSATVTVSGTYTYTYTGSAIEPNVTVKLGNTTLTKGTDYTVAYANNIDAGEATVTVTFTGNYTGSASATFEIAKADQTLTVTAAKSARYGTTLDLSSLVSGNQGELTFTLPSETNGYSLSGSTLTVSSTVGATVDVTVTAAATTNYNASSEYTITVTSIDKTDVSSAITFADGSATYTGEEQSYENAAITGYSGGTWTYTYAAGTGTLGDNGKPLTAGTYTVTATYEDDENMGSKSATFTIEAKAISADDFTVAAAAEYTGEAITSAVTSDLLIAGTDYTVAYTNNTEVGTATVTVSGQGNYTGTVELTFEITAADISDDVSVVIAEGTYTYTAEEITPDVTVYLNDEALTAGTDYSVAYANNIDAGEATVTVTFTGNYTGTATATFTINGADRSDPTITASPVALNDDYCVTLSGSSLTTTLTVTPAENDGAEITYSSSDTSVVSVNSGGVITALANGDAEITVTVAAKGSYNAYETIVGVTAITDPVTDVEAEAYFEDETEDADAGSVTAYLDGTTVVVAGLVDKAATVAVVFYRDDVYLETGTKITYDADSAAFAADPASVEVEGVTYTIDVSGLVESSSLNIDSLTHAETVASVSSYISEADSETVKAAAESVTGDLTAHVSVLAADVSDALASLLESNESISSEKNYTIDVEVYFEVTAIGYSAGTDESAASLKLEVTPKYTVKATEKNNESAEAVTLVESATISNNQLSGTVSFTIDLPSGFPTDGLIAKHYDTDGVTVKNWIKPVIATSDEKTTATISTDSFSEFELAADNRSAKVNYNFYDDSIVTVTYTAADIGTAFKSDTRSGYTFAGWATAADAASAEYSGTLTDSYLTALAEITNDINFYPVFTSNNTNHSSGGSSSSSYSVSSSTSVAGGTVSFSSTSAAAGRTVTVTVTPDEGYVLASLTVTDADGNTIEVTDNGGGTYSFTMPSSEVTVTPVFVEENCPSEPYTDVDTSKWYHSAIDYALNNGYFSGTSATTFEPDASMTRAMFVQVLANIAGIDASEYAGSSFTDVADDAWYAAAVEWAYQNGIVLGVTDDTFAPETTISREQMVVMLYRYAEYLGEDVSNTDETAMNAFADSASVSDWAVTAMAWAVNSDIINGTETGIEPQRDATRAEAAQMFKNFDERA